MLNSEVYHSIQHIPKDVFSVLGGAVTFHFTKEFLESFEVANPHLEPSYIVWKSKDTNVGLAVLYSFEVPFSSAANTASPILRLGTRWSYLLSKKAFSVLVCGNPFLSGNYGVLCADDTVKRAIYDDLAVLMIRHKRFKKASTLLVKDFAKTDQHFSEELQNHQFQKFVVAPNMLLRHPYRSFEAFKAALKSKYRIKVNKADRTSDGLVVRNFDVMDIRQHQSALQKLYQNIIDKAVFNLVQINISTYALLKERFRESVIFNTYWYRDTLVAFATAFMIKGEIHAHFIGMEYTYNKKLALYPRILNDYVRLGIDHKASVVNLGRTASEIKSTLGARPESLVCYMKHRKSLTNRLLRPFLSQLKADEFKQHQPFKV